MTTPSGVSDSALITARARSSLRHLLDAVLVVVALSAMIWMDRHQPTLTANQAPFPTRGRIGAPVEGRDFALTVDQIALTRAVDIPPAYGNAPVQRRETDGVWVLVQARLDARQEPMTIPGGALGVPSLRSGDGTEYAFAGGRLPTVFPLLTSGRAAAPGIPARGLLLFELPAERLAGAVLVASTKVLPDLDSRVEIDLGLTADDVRRRLASMPPSITLDRTRGAW